MASSHCRTGFALIELLVVIAAFAIRRFNHGPRLDSLRRMSVFLAFAVLIAPAMVADGAKAPRVLMLFANDRLLPANVRIDEGFRRTLDPKGNQSAVTIFTEFLDVARLIGAEHEQMMEEYLRRRYRDVPPDVLIVVGPEALDFWFERRGRLFPGTPVVFGGVGVEELRSLEGISGVTGLPMETRAAPIVESLLAMRPQTRQIVLVHGSSEFDRRWREIALRQCRPFTNRVEITSFPELPLEELKARLAALPAEAAVIYFDYYQSPTGETYTPARVAREIAEASAVPVMGPYDTYLGTGVLGVNCSVFEDEGAAIGKLTRRVLSGERPASIGILPPNPTRLIVDERQVNRWGIESLPAGTEVRFHTLTLWEEHRWFIIGVVAIVVLQAWLIAHLLLQRRYRLRAEFGLRESEQRFRSLADTAPVMIWMSGPDQKCNYFNQRWLDFTGRPPEAELGDGWMASVHPDDLDRRVLGYRDAFESRAPLTVEYRLRRHDGEYRWILAQAVPRLTASGEFLGYVGSCQDITDRREAEDANRSLAHAQRLATVGELTAMIAHEINQPLGAILSNAEAAEMLLDSQTPPLGPVREILADIRKDDLRASEAIQRIRALLRKRETEMLPLDLNEAVVDVLRLASGDLLRRGVQTHQSLTVPLPLARGDRVHLQHVVLNLVLNGMDAMNENADSDRRLFVSTHYNGNGLVEVAVKDVGHGIAAENLPRLFDSFFTTKRDGMGLGLSIARSIVLLHSGRLWAENNADGKGATFHFTVPLNGVSSSNGTAENLTVEKIG